MILLIMLFITTWRYCGGFGVIMALLWRLWRYYGVIVVFL